ncbi:MAG: hypothetical protein AAGC81_02240 [Pseudomonadota bacterium]
MIASIVCVSLMLFGMFLAGAAGVGVGEAKAAGDPHRNARYVAVVFLIACTLGLCALIVASSFS